MIKRISMLIIVFILAFSLFSCSENNDNKSSKKKDDSKTLELDLAQEKDTDKKDTENEKSDKNEKENDDEEEKKDDELKKDDYQDFQQFDDLSLSVKYNLIKSFDGINTSYSITYNLYKENERFEIISNQKRFFIVYNRDDNRTYIWDDEAVGKIEKGRVIDFIYMPQALNSKAIVSEDLQAVIEKKGDTLKGETKQFIDDEHGIADVTFSFNKGSFFPSEATYTLENMTLNYVFEPEEVKESFRENTFSKPDMIQFESEEYNAFSLNPDLKGKDLIKTFPESYNFSFGTLEQLKIFTKSGVLEFATNNLYAENGKFNSFVLNNKSEKSDFYARSVGNSDDFIWNKDGKIDKNFGNSSREDLIIKFYVENLLYRDMGQTLKSESSKEEIINAELVKFQGEECVLVERLFKDKDLDKITENTWYSVKNKYPVKRILKHNGNIIFESETKDIKPNAEYKEDDFSM